MAKSNSDSGAARNNGNLQKLITELTNMGDGFEPAQPTYTLAALSTLHADSVLAATTLKHVKAKFHPVIETKEKLFDKAGKLLSRIVAALVTAKASPGTLEMARGYVNKYRGSVKAAREEDLVEEPVENGETPVNGNGETKPDRSNRQTSYDFLIQHFEGLVSIAANHIDYKPKPVELQVAALQDLLVQMRQAVKDSDQEWVALRNAREAQWKLHDHMDTGIVALAQMAKAQILSDFGFQADEYKRVKGLQFKNLKQKKSN